MAHAPQLHGIAQEDFLADILRVADTVANDGWSPDFVVGIGRGGLAPAVYLSHRLDRPMLSIDHSTGIAAFAEDRIADIARMSVEGRRLLLVDDINDSGETIRHIRTLFENHGGDGGNLRVAVLIDNVRSTAAVDYRGRTIDRDVDKRWFVFPWEAVASNAAIVREALSVPERLA